MKWSEESIGSKILIVIGIGSFIIGFPLLIIIAAI